MRKVLFVLGVFVFPLGITSIWAILSQLGTSYNRFTYFSIIPAAIAIGFLAMIIHAFRHGWRESDLKGLGKIATALLIINVLFTGILGDFRSTGLFSILGINVVGLWLTPYIMIGINVGARYIYPKYPRPAFWLILGAINLLLFAVMAYFILTEQDSEYVHKNAIYLTINLLARLFVIGLLTGFVIRNLELKTKWEGYVLSGSPLVDSELKAAQELNEEALIARLTHYKIVMRSDAIESLKARNTPRVLDAIARAVEKAPPFYLFQINTVTCAWKILKREGNEAITAIKARNKPFLESFPHVYCARDWAWAKKHETPGGMEYVMCDVCGQHDALYANIHHAKGIIGTDINQVQRGDTFYISMWDEGKQQINEGDITELEIQTGHPTLNYDWAISAFVQYFENKLSNKDRKIPVKIDHPEALSPNAKAILQTISTGTI